eukprot:4216614-Amphidinium_carterae.1
MMTTQHVIEAVNNNKTSYQGSTIDMSQNDFQMSFTGNPPTSTDVDSTQKKKCNIFAARNENAHIDGMCRNCGGSYDWSECLEIRSESAPPATVLSQHQPAQR